MGSPTTATATTTATAQKGRPRKRKPMINQAQNEPLDLGRGTPMRMGKCLPQYSHTKQVKRENSKTKTHGNLIEYAKKYTMYLLGIVFFFIVYPYFASYCNINIYRG